MKKHSKLSKKDQSLEGRTKHKGKKNFKGGQCVSAGSLYGQCKNNLTI